MNYLVEWDILVNANSPEEAARMALEIMRDPESTALVFVVSDETASYVFDLEDKE